MYIFTGPGLASCRRPRLTSNVRPPKSIPARFCATTNTRRLPRTFVALVRRTAENQIPENEIVVEQRPGLGKDDGNLGALAKSIPQEAGSRKQEAGSRKQEAGSRKQEALSRRPNPGTENREPRTENREPRTENREPRAESREPRARSQEPGSEFPGAHFWLWRTPREPGQSYFWASSSPRASRWPNPSVEARPNGKPPGPGHRYAVHYLWPGPGVLPSAPPHLQR